MHRRRFLQGALALGALGCAYVDSEASIVRRNAVLVVNADKKEVIYQKNAHELVYPASTTKLMTLYLMFDALDEGHLKWDEKIRFSKRAADTPASKLWVPEGYEMSVTSAVKALIVKSANDVAVAVAEHMAGSVEYFVPYMNGKAHHLGMTKTVFKNPHGLPNAQHVSTAYDMAILGWTMINRPKYYPLFATKTWGNYTNTNGLLFTYPGCDGLKTGYIQASGSNLVASAKRGGKRALVAYFGGASSAARNRDVTRYLNQAFQKI
jgi:D-alanyl-D-alanine carboxypeptidase